MADSIAGVVLAAGAGERLRPLTRLRPKVLCPLGDRPLVDHAIDRFRGTTSAVAVNVHHGRDLLESHLAGRVHLSIEHGQALGTAGALGLLRDWIAERPTLVVNGDTWCPTPVGVLLEGWDGERTRVLVHDGAELRRGVRVAGALVPWDEARRMAPTPSGLYQTSWRDAARDGRLEVVSLPGRETCVDCGTALDYLEANLAWSGGTSVVGVGALVEGTISESVVWPGAEVRRGERLHRAIRAHERMTVLVR
jgi:mannose-1-phosphate guanylyltransferase/MurNAc alpha-1-phosphate uridylyltransferase